MLLYLWTILMMLLDWFMIHFMQMKMMSRTSITSMSGVMLMSDMLSLCLGWVASWEWMIQRRCLFAGGRTAAGAPAGGSNILGGLPNPAPI